MKRLSYRDAVLKAKSSNEFTDVAVYYTVAFNSFDDLNIAFQVLVSTLNLTVRSFRKLQFLVSAERRYSIKPW